MPFAVAPLAALGQSVAIGLGADITSMDPHYHLVTSNANVAEHVFDTLIHKDDKQRLKPGLALSWRPIDDSTWEFKLRPGVKFHDGSDFSADDVAFSIDRPATIKTSPGPYTIYTRAVIDKTIVDPLTIRFKTKGPYPLLPTDICRINNTVINSSANSVVITRTVGTPVTLNNVFGQFEVTMNISAGSQTLDSVEVRLGGVPAASQVFTVNGAPNAPV